MSSTPVDRPPTEGSRAVRIPRRRLVIATAVVTVLAAVGGIWWARPDAIFGPQAEAGELLGQPALDGPLTSASVRLPWGELRVAAGRPSDALPDDGSYSSRFDARYDEIDPPRGGAWLPLRVEKETSFGEVLFRSRPDATVPVTTITLRTGGRTILIASVPGGSGTSSTAQRIQAQLSRNVEGYLALPDGYDADDLVVRVAFAGVDQDVDLRTGDVTTGRAAGLYTDQPDDVDTPCGPVIVPGYHVDADLNDCAVTRLLRLPYVAGLGWARSGRAWLVVTATTTPPFRLSRTGSGQQYFRDYTEDAWTSALRYGSATPVAQARYRTVSTSVFVDVDDPVQFVYDVPVTDTGGTVAFTLTTTWPVYRQGSPDSDRTPVTVTGTRTIRASR